MIRIFPNIKFLLLLRYLCTKPPCFVWHSTKQFESSLNISLELCLNSHSFYNSDSSSYQQLTNAENHLAFFLLNLILFILYIVLVIIHTPTYAHVPQVIHKHKASYMFQWQLFILRKMSTEMNTYYWYISQCT